MSDRKTQVLLALISAAVGLTAAYWQFVYKPAHPSLSDTALTVPYAGRVIDVNTKQTISGAKVSVEAQGAPQVYYSDSEGVFYLKLRGSTEAVRIRVEANNYQLFDRNVSLSRSGIEDVRLAPIVTPTPTITPTPSATPTPKSTAKLPRSSNLRTKPPCPAADRLLGNC